VKAANWLALAWTVAGIGLTLWLTRSRPDKLRDIERVYVEDETDAPPARPAMETV
jgi:hypothetical protein